MSNQNSTGSFRPAWLEHVRIRLSTDFYMSLLVVFALIAISALLPFFVFRLITGDLAAAIGNGVVIVFLMGAFVFAWCTGRTRLATHAIVVGMALACLYMVAVIGHPTHWVYPTVVANFMLVKWRFALIVNLVLVALILTMAPPYPTLVETLSFVTALVLVAAFAMFFVIHTDFHRERLSVLLEHDALTGALNRRALGGHLEQALARLAKSGDESALAVMDLDDFKQINDLHGHETGDRILVDLTRTVISETRRGDQFYRLGGEEFVLLLANTDRSGAVTIFDKLHPALREPLELEDGPVTVSVGVAMPRQGDSWSSWLARADEAMYKAKARGKDCIVFAD